ncbi:MAG: hypothetical protein GXO78_05950 [Calditrichaeota bacterium]|nr:hypothetical protein [Calditrichota bacterium]
MAKKKVVAFVSQRNVCRSIIAEAYAKRLGQEVIECFSFGLEPDRVHYLVQEVLAQRGFNLTYYFSKRYEVVERQPFDILVLMHPSLKEQLPQIGYPHEEIVWEFEDPMQQDIPEAEKRKAIEQLCDAIEQKVKELVASQQQVA